MKTILTALLCVILTSAFASAASGDTGTIPAGPFQLRYRIEGTGTPALVIGSAIIYPRVFSENLRRHMRLVFLDHRGFAASPGKVDNAEFALDVLIEDMERARQQLNLGRIAVIGHSGNSFMALEYAKKYPANVSHVIMIGIAPDLSPASAAAAERYWEETASPERKAALAENLRRVTDEDLAKLGPSERFFRGYIRNGPKIWFDPHFDSTPLWAGVEANTDMADYVWGQVFRDLDITRGLDTFDRPVFLALGRHDFLVAPPSSWDPVRDKFRDLTIRIFERSGHAPQYDEPERFDAELLTWMKGKTGSTAAKPTGNPADSTTLVNRYLHEFWGRGNLGAIHEIFAPEITMHYLGRERPLTPAQHEAGARAFRGAFPDLTVSSPTLVTAGDHVVAHTLWTGTHLGPIAQLGGRAEAIAPTRQRLEWSVLYLFRIADGRIVEMWEEWNEGGFVERLRL